MTHKDINLQDKIGNHESIHQNLDGQNIKFKTEHKETLSLLHLFRPSGWTDTALY